MHAGMQVKKSFRATGVIFKLCVIINFYDVLKICTEGEFVNRNSTPAGKKRYFDDAHASP